MPRERFCKVCHGWHDLDKPWPDNCLPERNWSRSELPSPMLVRDAMDPVQSMATGKMYDSKSAIRREYKQLGMVEVGNDPARLKPFKKPKTDRKVIRETIEKAEARFNRGERSLKQA